MGYDILKGLKMHLRFQPGIFKVTEDPAKDIPEP